MWNGVQSEDLDTVSTSNSSTAIQHEENDSTNYALENASETSNTKPISTIVEIESNGVTLKQTMKNIHKEEIQ
jgi:hypothetical protein